jgi:hypothetical protein
VQRVDWTPGEMPSVSVNSGTLNELRSYRQFFHERCRSCRVAVASTPLTVAMVATVGQGIMIRALDGGH